MADWEVSDELWARIKPLLPVVQRRSRYPGRRRLDDRACLNGILFVLVTGMRWDRLPPQLGYGSGVTCWRRLRDWATAGVWDALHELLLALLLAELHATELHATGRIDWSRAAVDGSHVRAKRRLCVSSVRRVGTALVGDQALIDDIGKAPLEAPQGFLAGLALSSFALVVDRPAVSWLIWQMAIRCRTWLSWRLPARDSRWRTTWPLEASIGAVPV